MSQSDRSSTISDNESKDRSLTEWNFSNPKKYMLKTNKDTVLDVNDVEVELFRSEKLPHKYGISHRLPVYHRKYNVNGKANKVSENDISSTQNEENITTDSFVSSISNIVLRDFPLVNSNNSYAAISNDQNAMSNSLSKSKSSHAIYSENIINQNVAHKRNSFNKNVQQIPKDIEDNAMFKSSQGMNYHLREHSQNKNLDMAFLQSNELHSQNVKGIRKYHSTLNLKDSSDQIPKPTKSKSPSQPPISKSLSLNNLAYSRTMNYDHIQSKVKWYIQERKRHEKRQSKSCESRSLPVTPVKGKTADDFDGKSLLKLDEEYLENLCISNKRQREDLPDDLKQLKAKILTENVDKNLVEIIFNRLKMEREGRIDKDIILNALQLHYDDLLAKYAEAKNLIDDLRFYKDEQSEKKDSVSTDKNSNFKKAYSTSNIFQECSTSSYDFNVRPFSSNLVRYSSSPLVDPDIVQKMEENDEEEEKPMILNSLSKRSYSTVTLNTSIPIDFGEWFEKYEHLNQKLKEFIILEANSALNKDEREQILNYIIKYLSELETEYLSFDQSSASEDCRRKLEEIKDVIENVNTKYAADIPTIKYDNIKDEKFLKSSRAEFFTLPSNSSYSKIIGPGVIDTPFSSPAKIINSSPKKQLTSTAIYTNDKPKPSFLKYSNQRDADSGCPPSDRSTRNSQYPSFEQSESLTTNATGPEALSRLGGAYRRSVHGSTEDLIRRKSIDSFLNLSSINLGIEDNHKRRLYNRKDYRYRSLHTFDEDYDASASSDLEDSYEDERSKRCVKKRLSKSSRSPSKSNGLPKYEDKFVCNHRSRTADSRSTKYETNKHLLGMSQMEKNSKYFEVQVKDLKLKGLLRKRVDKKRYSLPYRPNTPLKALNKDNLSLINISDLSISSTPDGITCQVGNGKGSVSLLSLNQRDDQTLAKECTSCVHCSFPIDSVPTFSHRKFSTSTPKSHDSEMTMCDCGLSKEPLSASSYISNERSKIGKRSVSLSSLNNLVKLEIANPTGTDSYAQQHSGQAERQNSCSNTRAHRTDQESMSNMQPRYKKNKSINESYKTEYSTFIRCLDEATHLAEGIQSKTQARNFRHLNILPSTAHR